VVEEQVEAEVTTVDRHALLALDEGEADSELQQESLDLVEDRGLELGLRVLAGRPRKSSTYGSRKRMFGPVSSGAAIPGRQQ
jgi:hypothetical protein